MSSVRWTNTGLTNGLTYSYNLTATNAFGVSDVSPLASARPTSTTVVPLTFSLSPGQISLGWPANHTGWRLLVQTNTLVQGLGTNWWTLANSSSTNSVVLSLSLTNRSVFFRLVYP